MIHRNQENYSSKITALVGHMAAPFIFNGNAMSFTLNFSTFSTFIIGAISRIFELKNLSINFSGFFQPNQDEMSVEMRKKLEESGLKILTNTHLLGGVDRALRLKFEGVYPSEIVSTTLRMFGQGIKVCVEISVMAADAGLAKAGEDLIVIGGTGKGADTAAVINPSHSQNFFDTKIREVICKPYNF